MHKEKTPLSLVEKLSVSLRNMGLRTSIKASNDGDGQTIELLASSCRNGCRSSNRHKAYINRAIKRFIPLSDKEFKKLVIKEITELNQRRSQDERWIPMDDDSIDNLMAGAMNRSGAFIGVTIMCDAYSTVGIAKRNPVDPPDDHVAAQIIAKMAWEDLVFQMTQSQLM